MVVREYIDDLGGQDCLSTGQLVVLRQIRQGLVFQALLEEALVDGIHAPDGQIKSALHPVWLAVSNNLVRQAEKLGLHRVVSSPTLGEYLAEIDERKGGVK